MKTLTDMIAIMVQYFGPDSKRIQHFMKVWAFAKTIGEQEMLDEKTEYNLEIAAIMHDIGAHIAEEKYNSTSNLYKTIEGPSISDMILLNLGIDRSVIERVHFLVANHNTYSGNMDKDLQILIEADFLVNSYEEGLEVEAIRSFRDKYFKTATGTKLLNDMYGLFTPEDEERIFN